MKRILSKKKEKKEKKEQKEYKKPIFTDANGTMALGEKERSVMDKNLPLLQKSLNAKNVMKHLKRSGVVDDKEEEFIMKKKGGKSTKEDQVVALLDFLKGRTDGFTVLVTALAQSKSQDHLAKELLQDSTFTPQELHIHLEKVEKGLDDSQKRKLRKICEKSPPATPDRRDSLIVDSESNYSLSVSSLAEGSIQHDVFDSSTNAIHEEHPGAQEEPRKGPTAGDENVTWTGQEETIVHEFGLRNQKGIHSDENQGIGNKAPIEALDSQAQLSSPPNVTEDPGGAQPVSSESTKESESYEVTQDDIKELEEKGKNIHEVRREDEKDINGDDDLGNVNEASIEALQSQAQLSSPPNEMGDLGGTQLESRETTKGSESEEDIQRVVETLNEKDRNVEEVRLGDEKDFTGDDNLGHEDETPIEALDSQDKLLSPQNIMEDLGGTQLVSSETIQESESNEAIQEDTKRLHEKDVHELRLEDEKDFNGENLGNGSEAPIETLDNQAQLSSPQTEDLGGTQPVSSKATESEEVIQQVTKRLKEKNKSFLADDRRNTFPRVKPKSSRDSLFMDMEIMRNRCQIESMRNVVETLRKLRESTQVLQEKLHGENQRLQMLRSNTHRLLF